MRNWYFVVKNVALESKGFFYFAQNNGRITPMWAKRYSFGAKRLPLDILHHIPICGEKLFVDIIELYPN